MIHLKIASNFSHSGIGMKFNDYTLPKTNSSPLKIAIPKRKGLSPKHHICRGELLVLGSVYQP